MRDTLIEFMDELREYVAESGTNIAHDERDSSEFVDVFLKKGQPLLIDSVMQWVLIHKDNLPPLHKHVILYDISNDNQKIQFIHEGTSIDNYRYWTHYAEIKKPFA
tara:strand:- start:176 stop:493 length:318 start_codon:yes stop_codon:yes gene_type:complete